MKDAYLKHDNFWESYPRAIYGSIQAIQNFRCVIYNGWQVLNTNFCSRFSNSMEGLVYTYKADTVHHKQNIFGLYGSCMASRKTCMASKKTYMASRSGSCMAYRPYKIYCILRFTRIMKKFIQQCQFFTTYKKILKLSQLYRTHKDAYIAVSVL